MQLFAARARAADPTFTLDPSTIEPIASICQQVDGLPFAIELAAGQPRVLSPQAILNRLDHRLDLLTHGPTDQPERQQSLEQAIRWSYDLLSPDEQQAFRHLGVFAGGFTEDAARHIAPTANPPPRLAPLIDASLVLHTVQPDGESRYALLETIREFCLLELQAQARARCAREAHATYYLQLAARAEPRLIVIGSAEWVRRLAVEHANLHAAVEWSLAHDDPEPVLALAGTLLSMAYAQGEPAESLSWLERAIALAEPEPTPLLCDARFAASALAQVQGNFERSVAHASGSLEMARAAGYPFGEGRALLGLGISAEWERDLDVAEQRYRAARAIMDTLDPSTRLAHWRVLPVANLADIALIRGRYQEAIDLGSEAIAAWREAGYLWGTAQALGTVAAARCELGDLDGARRDYRETLDLWIACADGRGLAGTIAGIAGIAIRTASPQRRACSARHGASGKLGMEYVAHHLYAEQVRAAVFGRPNLDPALIAGGNGHAAPSMRQLPPPQRCSMGATRTPPIRGVEQPRARSAGLHRGRHARPGDRRPPFHQPAHGAVPCVEHSQQARRPFPRRSGCHHPPRQYPLSSLRPILPTPPRENYAPQRDILTPTDSVFLPMFLIPSGPMLPVTQSVGQGKRLADTFTTKRFARRPPPDGSLARSSVTKETT